MPLYFYGIIRKPEKFKIESQGLLGEKIKIILYKKIAAVVSNANTEDLEFTQENIFNHDDVLSEIFKKYDTVLPASFGMVAQNKEVLIEKVLKPQYADLLKEIENLSGKIEIDLKAVWTDMEDIYKEILVENPDLIKAQKIMQERELSFEEKIEIGKKIYANLSKKKTAIKEAIIKIFGDISQTSKELPTKSEDIVFNLSFLVPKDNNQTFNKKLNLVGQKLKNESIYLKKVGPLVPFNFFHLKISP